MDRPQDLTAVDIMQANVKSVPPDMSLPDLETMSVESGISGFPVVDQGTLVGVVSRTDVVRRLCTEREVAENVSDFHFDERGFHEVKMESFQDIADRVGERIESLTVRDVMNPDPLTVPVTAPLHVIARRCVDHRVHRLPVTENGRLLGIVTTMDLVRLMAERTAWER